MVNELAQKMLVFLFGVILPLVTGYMITRLTKSPREKLFAVAAGSRGIHGVN